MLTACFTGELLAIQAVTYPPVTTHSDVYANISKFAGRLWLSAARFGNAFGKTRISRASTTASIANELTVNAAIPANTANMLRIIV